MEPLTGEGVAARLEAHQLAVGLEAATALARFLDRLEHWNRVHNLTGLRDRNELIDRHLVESLALERFVAGARACDIGSGAGLPGIPLAVVLPDVVFTLIESRRKRASFLRHVKGALGLDNVEVVHARAETVTTGPFDTVLARAVAPPGEILDLAEPLVAPTGRLVLLTSEDKAREILSRARGFRALPIESVTPGLRSRVVVLERASVSESSDLE
ncbi:MAG TPA: 16S rRNA (guanine(527)-N(7))-methyltransferase RsmG [Gammaproteobacteria bacterium]|nr:16S rRNA (guanine(527)-N(7))-methyltransferase RsmG [Gammaproteobacteria bacterium]